MTSTARLDVSIQPTPSWPRLAPLTARTLQAGWLLLLLGALAVAIASTPALHQRYLEICPQPICDTLPQPNAQTVDLLERLGVSLHQYASFIIGVEWLSLLAWCVLGAILVWKRTRDLVALLLAYGGVVGASKAFLDVLSDSHPDVVLPARIGLLVTVVTVPLIFALFPDGRWIPHWMRWVALAVIGYGIVAQIAGNPLPALLAALELPLGMAPLVVLLAAQVYRYRRVSNVVERQQTKWVIFGFGLFIANLTVGSLAFAFGAAAPFQLVFLALCYGVFLLLGIAVTFAVLRYRLFDIDVILNRTLVYGGLTAAVVGMYALVVSGLGALFQSHGEPVVALLATGMVAVAFAPMRDRLQRGANRLLYGDRDDPYAVLTRLGQRLEGALATEEILPAVVRTMTEALRLPYAAIVLHGANSLEPAAAAGMSVSGVIRLPLVYQAEPVGELVVAPRSPGEVFSAADRRLLEDLARQIGVAAHTVRLTADLQRSRERIVSAREEERRRLRRDLHDGLGAQLAALAIQAGALRTSIQRDPNAAQEQASELRTELRAAVADIRRLVHGLRPPALDELGLIGALQERVARFETGGDFQTVEGERVGDPALTVSVSAGPDLPILPAAVEVAVYRIVEEAVTNVARHAAARTCQVCLEVTDWLTLTVDDDGIGLGPERGVGVGLVSMRERAEELGGRFTVGARMDGLGTRLVVRLPLSPPER